MTGRTMTSDEPVARRTDGPESAPAVRRSRGDRQREAIVNAVRELLEGRSFEELSVSAISERAGITRSGFYFYFESKYDVLALIFDEVTHELEELTHYFAPRGTDETPAAFATRMVGSARPISEDIPALVRTLGVTTAMMLSGDTSYLEPDRDLQRGVRVLEQLWLAGLWGGSAGDRQC